MKKIILGLVLLFLTSCVLGPSYEELRSQNRSKLSQITIGKSISEVEKIMGKLKADSDNYGNRGEEFSNPYKKELIEHKGKYYLIYYYYTERFGNNPWQTGVTPVIFESNEVVGTGWRTMESLGLESKSTTIKVR
jgi:hypothetical protein